MIVLAYIGTTFIVIPNKKIYEYQLRRMVYKITTLAMFKKKSRIITFISMRILIL